MGVWGREALRGAGHEAGFPPRRPELLASPQETRRGQPGLTRGQTARLITGHPWRPRLNKSPFPLRLTFCTHVRATEGVWEQTGRQRGEVTACSVAGQGAGVTGGPGKVFRAGGDGGASPGSENPAETLNRRPGKQGLHCARTLLEKGEKSPDPRAHLVPMTFPGGRDHSFEVPGF